MFFRQQRRVVVIGCSNMGSTIAADLNNNGDNVTIIDKDAVAFNKLHYTFSGFQIEDDATKIGVLKDANCDKADIVLVATDDDSVNSLIAQIAKVVLNAKKVIVRLDDEDYDSILSELNIEIIHPSNLSLNAFKDLTKESEDTAK